MRVPMNRAKAESGDEVDWDKEWHQSDLIIGDDSIPPRGRERSRLSAVERLVERKKQKEKKESARSNSNSRNTARATEYKRSQSANGIAKTYITIGPGTPARIREVSPTKRAPNTDPPKIRRSSVPIRIDTKTVLSPPTPLKSSRLLKSFTTERSFEVNADQKRKHSFDFSESIHRSSPESDESSESVSKRRVSMQERFYTDQKSKRSFDFSESIPRSSPESDESSDSNESVSKRRVSMQERFYARACPQTKPSPQPTRARRASHITVTSARPPHPPRKTSLQNPKHHNGHKELIRFAEAKKEEGNELFKKNNYKEALSKYSEAISMCPDNASYYGNRSACYIMLEEYQRALEDAKISTKLDTKFIKGYVRAAKCCLLLGNIASSRQVIDKGLSFDPSNSSLLEEKNSIERLEHYKLSTHQAYNTEDYRTALYFLDQCLLISKADCVLKVKRAECLALLGRYIEAQDCANSILRLDSTNADALYVRGVCLYYENNIEKSINHFSQSLKLAPDHSKSKHFLKKAKLLKDAKDEGNEAFRNGNLHEAYRLYTEALEVDPLNKVANSILYCNRATVAGKLGKLQNALSDCSAALNLDDSYTKARLRRAKTYMELEEYEDAVRDYEHIVGNNRGNPEYTRLLRDAKMELKKSKRKDYYKVLGVHKNAGEEEIKKAYKKRALSHHPDRHAGATDEEKNAHEKTFKEIGEAYAILLDPVKRSKYDSGMEMDNYDGDVSQMFNARDFFHGLFPGSHSFGGSSFSYHFR